MSDDLEQLKAQFNFTDEIVDEMTRDEELEDALRLVRRHEVDCMRTNDAAGERVLAKLRDELERKEHRR